MTQRSWLALSFLTLSLALGACRAPLDAAHARSEFAQEALEYTDRSLAEIDAAKPQIKPPFRLAISAPRGRNSEPWRQSERDQFASWAATLRRDNIVSDIAFLPSDASSLPEMRKAAVREHADALLVVRERTAENVADTPLAIFDLLIVPAFLFPSTKPETLTMLEAVVIDTRNEYLYASAYAEAAADRHSPRAFADDALESLKQRSRRDAIEKLGQELRAVARRHMTAAPAPTAAP